MTLKELLEEQEEKLNGILGGVPEVLEQFKGMTCPICGQPSDKSPQVQELKNLFRQSNIETVKWVMKMIDGLSNVEIQTKQGNIESKVELQAVFRKDIKSELNKVIE
jgi:DNA repair exonuclease SbcCD ATPase subunit